ncbi:MAG TPA: hypothetical protein VJN22_07985 [Candidatus Eremiobacteraceae bacterium]|nr:hypothetical protein [Candidatus Eremiobacteraceae bacterium]
MSCYFHPAVPTAVLCRECNHEICSTCSVDGVCPGCRLGHAIGANAPGPRKLNAAPGGSGATNAGATSQASAPPPPGPERTRATVTNIEPQASPEDRLLAAICYPLWPLALLMLFIQSHRTQFVRFHVVQALGVNALGVLVYLAYNFASNLPVVGWQSALFLPFMMPAWFFIDLYLAVRTYAGHSPRVPIAADYAEKYAA